MQTRVAPVPKLISHQVVLPLELLDRKKIRLVEAVVVKVVRTNHIAHQCKGLSPRSSNAKNFALLNFFSTIFSTRVAWLIGNDCCYCTCNYHKLCHRSEGVSKCLLRLVILQLQYDARRRTTKCKGITLCLLRKKPHKIEIANGLTATVIFIN